MPKFSRGYARTFPRNSGHNPAEPPLGFWLWLLCGLLAVWGPLALEASGALAGLLYGDAAAALALAARAGLAGLGVAAALALYRRREVGLALARIYLAGSVGFALARAGTSVLPSTFAPSDEVDPLHRRGTPRGRVVGVSEPVAPGPADLSVAVRTRGSVGASDAPPSQPAIRSRDQR